jgi:hypothetical protein
MQLSNFHVFEIFDLTKLPSFIDGKTYRVDGKTSIGGWCKKKPSIWTWGDVEWNGQRHKSNGHLHTIEERQSL